MKDSAHFASSGPVCDMGLHHPPDLGEAEVGASADWAPGTFLMKQAGSEFTASRQEQIQPHQKSRMQLDVANKGAVNIDNPSRGEERSLQRLVSRQLPLPFSLHCSLAQLEENFKEESQLLINDKSRAGIWPDLDLRTPTFEKPQYGRYSRNGGALIAFSLNYYKDEQRPTLVSVLEARELAKAQVAARTFNYYNKINNFEPQSQGASVPLSSTHCQRGGSEFQRQCCPNQKAPDPVHGSRQLDKPGKSGSTQRPTFNEGQVVHPVPILQQLRRQKSLVKGEANARQAKSFPTLLEPAPTSLQLTEATLRISIEVEQQFEKTASPSLSGAVSQASQPISKNTLLPRLAVTSQRSTIPAELSSSRVLRTQKNQCEGPKEQPEGEKPEMKIASAEMEAKCQRRVLLPSYLPYFKKILDLDEVEPPQVRALLPAGCEDIEVIWGIELNKLPAASKPKGSEIPPTKDYKLFQFKNPASQRMLKVLKCEVESCSKAFTKWFNFYDHLRQHQGDRPYECPFKESLDCAFSFTQKSNLKKHLLVHFKRQPSLRQELRLSHPGLLENVMEKRHPFRRRRRARN